ncbi:MAG: ROK family transcriptional regulator, partial [Anaerolineae bacterium]|nr:ROK family transcriptional regulator [Anaerolineae bacterium]
MNTSNTASWESARELSRRLVFAHIRRCRQTSHTEIVRATGLSKATVSSIIAELVAAGLVHETGNRNVSVGRPRVVLELVPDAYLLVGAELADDVCRVLLTDLYTKPVVKVTRPVSDTTFRSMLRLFEEVVGEATVGVAPSRVLGLGVAVPAQVHPPSGSVIYSISLNWRNLPLGQELSQRLGWPTAIVGRGHAASWGEASCGAGQSTVNLLYVRLGAGVGAGLVLNGQLYLGNSFIAADLGHFIVQPGGRLCGCGNRGCLETVASTGAFLSRTRQLLRKSPEDPLWQDIEGDMDRLTLEQAIAAAQGGNRIVLQSLTEIGHWLGQALASTVNLLNLDMIIIGGPLAQAGEMLLEPLRD